jgi:transcription elongation GreA/GreB family factor
MSTQAILSPVDDHLRPPLEQAARSGRPIITPEHERALLAELDGLRRRLEVEFAERLREARRFGSAGANDDYLQIKEEEAVLAAGIAHISMLLDTALVVDPAEVGDGVATLGSVVEIRDLESGRRQKLRLISGHETLSRGVASAGSPVGQALMGQRPGHAVEIALPNGTTRRLEILAVDAQRP